MNKKNGDLGTAMGILMVLVIFVLVLGLQSWVVQNNNKRYDECVAHEGKWVQITRDVFECK